MREYEYNADEVMFTSDTHFGHTNIIKFCDRPFKDAHHMNEELIRKWNEVVNPGQVVFHLGDFAYKYGQNLPRLLDRLNGDIILIRGNHDKESDLKYFKEVHDLAEVVVEGQRIIMCHYAMRVWNHSFRGSWHIYGHSHGTLEPDWTRKLCDIGVDSWGYKPVSFQQLKAEMLQHGRETVKDLNDGFITKYGEDANLLTPK
jgi:calcineurin-like phosphoesterase family protein